MVNFPANAADAVRDLVFDGAVIAVGGFGLGGNPFDLIEAVRDSGAKNLTIISNNMGVDGQGLGILLENGQVSKVISSYVGENKHFAQLYLDGKLEVEFSPQGTLAERLRAGGAGIAAFIPRLVLALWLPKAKTTRFSTAKPTSKSVAFWPTLLWCTPIRATAPAI